MEIHLSPIKVEGKDMYVGFIRNSKGKQYFHNYSRSELIGEMISSHFN